MTARTTVSNNCSVSGIGMAGHDDDPVYPAYVDPDGDRWNGFVVPLFDRATAKQIAEDLNAERPYLADDEGYVCTWNGDVLHMNRADSEGDPTGSEDETHDYGAHARNPIGGFNWTWQVVSTD